MKSYTIIPHTADVRLKVQAISLEDLFISALSGMNRILIRDYEKYLNKHSFMKEVSITSYDTTSLLIDFLSEVLTLSHIHKAIFHTIGHIEIQRNSLHALLLGTKVGTFTEDIKAVTYHEAEVNQQGDKYKTTIVFDI